MMENIFTEQLVKREATVKSRVIQVAIVLAALIAAALLSFVPQLMPVVPALVFVIIIAAIFFVRRQKIEFEYIPTDSGLDIDKIYAASSRRSVASIEFSSVSEIGPEVRTPRELKGEYNTIYDCGGSGEVYKIVYSGTGEEGLCAVLITPNERILSVLKRSISPRVWHE